MESSDAISVLFFFFDDGCNILLPSVGPLLRMLDPHPETPAYFGGFCYVTIFFCLLCQTLLHPLPPCILPLSSILTHMNLPTLTLWFRPGLAGIYIFICLDLYFWILSSGVTWSCLPPSTEGQSSVPGGPLFPDSRNCFHFSPLLARDILARYWGLPGDSDGKKYACNAGDPGLTLGSGRSLGEGNGNPFQYSCLENSMDRETWWVTVHGVTKSQT